MRATRPACTASAATSSAPHTGGAGRAATASVTTTMASLGRCAGTRAARDGRRRARGAASACRPGSAPATPASTGAPASCSTAPGTPTAAG